MILKYLKLMRDKQRDKHRDKQRDKHRDKHRDKQCQKRSFIFPGTFIHVRAHLQQKPYRGKKVQKNFLMGLKIW